MTSVLYLSAANLADRLFFKDFVHRFSFAHPVVVTHAEKPGDPATVRMTTRRISALLSEALVHNTAFTGEQRGMVKSVGNDLVVDKAAIEKLLGIVPVLVLGPLAAADGQTIVADGEALCVALKEAFSGSVMVFTDNPLSPLAAKPRQVDTEAERDRLIALYEEERVAIGRAYALRPAWLAGPSNMKL